MAALLVVLERFLKIGIVNRDSWKEIDSFTVKNSKGIGIGKESESSQH